MVCVRAISSPGESTMLNNSMKKWTGTHLSNPTPTRHVLSVPTSRGVSNQIDSVSKQQWRGVPLGHGAEGAKGI